MVTCPNCGYTPPEPTSRPARISKRVQRQDGMIYDNARQAAIANNVTPGAMSNHLNRRTGYATLGGVTYTRLED
jgi:hypothetical protein